MPYSLKGRNVLVTGGSRGLGEVICLKFAAQGSNVAINYVSSEAKAQELASKIEKEHGVKAVTIKGDASVEEDCIRTVQETIEKLGGLDIIIANAGYTRFSTYSDLNAPTVEDWDTCFAVNVKAPFFTLRAALPTLTANVDGGAFILTSSIAGKIVSGSSLPYSVTKAAQLHLMKAMAATQGPKVRVNAVLPGILLTEWGSKYPPEAIKSMEERAFLKRVTDLEDCAQAYIDLAGNNSMTGQMITVDSGLGGV